MPLHLESLYWVFTRKCNDFCDHCYNNSGPRGESIDTDALLSVVPNLPDSLGKIILSGGEPTVEMDKLEAICGALRARYGSTLPIYIQSNGDLLNEARLQRLLAMGVDRIDIVSIDRFHKKQGGHVERLRQLFQKFDMGDAKAPETDGKSHKAKQYAFWGATEDLWLGGNWARGRALETGNAKLDPAHNFCSLWSGALGFLENGTDKQEVHIQLNRLYPCCPTTYYSLGDVRHEKVATLLDRYREEPAFQHLNRGDIHSVGLEEGLSKEYIQSRIDTLGDVCLWCDEYFQKHYQGPKGAPRPATS